MIKTFLLPLYFLLLLCVTACAGPNPNPGERTADYALITEKDANKFASVSIDWADRGYPWAELRAGIAHAYEYGVKKDLPKAIYYLEKAASHYDENASEWEKGDMLSYGKNGYFNKNTDALLAHYHLAKIYYTEASIKNLKKAEEHISFTMQYSKGGDLFVCCEFAGGRYIRNKDIVDLQKNILNK